MICNPLPLGIIHEKQKKMTVIVNYTYQTTLYAHIPGGGITVTYTGKAEIQFADINGEQEKSIKILTVEVFVNEQRDPFASLPDEKDAPLFFAKAREAARQAYFEKRAMWM